MHRPMQDTACGEHETLVFLREIAEGADMAGPCAKTDGPFWTWFARPFYVPVFDESLADSAGPRETRNGAYRRREAFSQLDLTENVEVHHELHRRVLSALTFAPSLRCERPRTGHRPRTRARDGRTLDAHLIRRQLIITTFGARGRIMSTSRSACAMVQESQNH